MDLQIISGFTNNLWIYIKALCIKLIIFNIIKSLINILLWKNTLNQLMALIISENIKKKLFQIF